MYVLTGIKVNNVENMPKSISILINPAKNEM